MVDYLYSNDIHLKELENSYNNSTTSIAKENILSVATNEFGIRSIHLLLKGLANSSYSVTDKAKELIIELIKNNDFKLCNDELKQLEKSYNTSTTSISKENILSVAAELFGVHSIPLLLKALVDSSYSVTDTAKKLILDLIKNNDFKLHDDESNQLENLYNSSTTSTAKENILSVAAELLGVNSIPLLLKALADSSYSVTDTAKELIVKIRNEDIYKRQNVNLSKIEGNKDYHNEQVKKVTEKKQNYQDLPKNTDEITTSRKKSEFGLEKVCEKQLNMLSFNEKLSQCKKEANNHNKGKLLEKSNVTIDNISTLLLEENTIEEAPSCFISYSWDDGEHKKWVINLANKLYENGVKTTLDEWHLRPGMDSYQFMEKSIRDSDYVIIVCTPIYATKADDRDGGAGYESRIITGAMFSRNSNKSYENYIPIIRYGEKKEGIPYYLSSKKYVDFRDDGKFDESLEALLRTIHNVPKHSPPPIGKNPFLKNKSKEIAPHKSVSKQKIESLLKKDKTNSSLAEKVRSVNKPAPGTVYEGDTTYTGADLHDIIGLDDENFIEINATDSDAFISGEKLKIYARASVDDRIIIKERELVYETQIVQSPFNSNLWKDTYNIMGLFGDVYIPLKNNTPNKLTKILLDTHDKYTLRLGSELKLADGYELTAKQIDINGDRVWMELSKNGEFIDDKVIHVGDKIDGTWKFHTNVADEENVEVFRVNVTNLFQSQEDSLVIIEGIWLIDYENIIELEVGDKFDVLIVDRIADSSMIMVNEDPILLRKNSIQEIAEGMKLKVADSDNLAFKLIREYA